LILDNLGLTLKVGDANAKMAKSLGKTVEELTAEEKAMAILNATLEAGDQLIAQVGGTTDSAADSFAQMQTVTKNLTDELAVQLAPAVTDVTEKVLTVVETLGDWDTGYQALIDSLEAGLITQEEQNRLIRLYGEGIIDLEELLRQLNIRQKEATDAIKVHGRIIDPVTGQVRNLIGANEDLKAGYDDVTEATLKAKEAQAKLKLEMSDLKLFVAGPLGKEYENFKLKQKDLKENAEELRAKIAELGGEEYMTPQQSEEIDTLRGKLFGVSKEIRDLNEAIKSGELNKKKKLKATESLEELRGEAFKLETQIRKLGGIPYLTDKQKDELDRNREKLAEIEIAIGENAVAHEEATKRIMFSLLSQRAAINELTAVELASLNSIAREWGLLDQATYDYVTAADAYYQTLENDSIETMGIVRWELEKTLGITSDLKGAFGDLSSSLEGLSGTYDIKIRSFYETFGEWKGPQAVGPPAPGAPITEPKISGGTGKRRQRGGSVSAGEAYLVGERGPEMFVPGTSGNIIPNDQLRGARSSQRAKVAYFRQNNFYVENSAAAAMMVEQRRREEIEEIDRMI
jgi:hypothetical protein